MAQHWGTGPAFIYVGLGGAKGPLSTNSVGITTNHRLPIYLGTTEKTPRLQYRPSYKDVFDNSYGSVIPADKTYHSQDAMVTARFTRFNFKTLQELQDYSRHVDSLSVAGSDESDAIGSLIVNEDLAYRLWIVFPYAEKQSMKPGGTVGELPKGRRFLRAYLTND